jgi:tRNA (cytidine/uridine-2'-O-)-methyltransferase
VLRRPGIVADLAFDPRHHRRDRVTVSNRSGAPYVVAVECPDAADARVIIPLSRGRRSFNLTVSAAIGLSEALRQTGQFPAFHPQDFPSHD